MNISEQKFEEWRKEQIASLVRMGYPDAAKAFRDLGSVQWAGWQAAWNEKNAENDMYLGLLHMSKELLTTISRNGATLRPADWCDNFKAEVADRIEKIGAAISSPENPS